MKSPLDEIFKSLTSLQGELNKQNKVNIKQRNLEKVNQFLLERKDLLDEEFTKIFKSQEQKYIQQGNDPQIVKTYIEKFIKIKDENIKQLNDQIGGLENVRDRKNIESYKTFEELETIVDYVTGQVDFKGASLGSDIEIDAKPIYEDDIFEIYYADSPRACIKYKGSIPYGWCVSRNDSSNMFYTYRFKEHQPAFYFVKIKDRTKKELGFFSMVGNVFNGQFKDKHHFFVIQVVKGAKIGDTTTKQYIVTSAMNDGDIDMSWDEIIKIEPRIANLQKIFGHVELSPEDKEFYEKYKNGTDDETFCKLDYTSKRRYLDIYIRQEQLLSDTQFQCLPEDLMNLYVGFGVGLSENQFELIKLNKNLLKRYQQITERKLEEYLKNKNQNINFQYTELLILPEDKRKEFIMNINSNSIYSLLEKSNEPDKVVNLLNKYADNKGEDFVMKLNKTDIKILLKNSNQPDKIIDILNKYRDNISKDFVMNLSSSDIYQLIAYNIKKKRDKLINILFNVGGKDFVMKLNSDDIKYFLTYSNEPEKIINILDKYRDNISKDFVINLRSDDIYNLSQLSQYFLKEPDRLINILFNIGGKDFVMGLNNEMIFSLLIISQTPDKVIDLINQYDNNIVNYFVKKLIYYDIRSLIERGREPEKIKQILQQYGKLPKDNSNTPMNEIFNSLTSLQEELNEQRKLTIKESNIMKVQNFFKNKKNNQ